MKKVGKTARPFRYDLNQIPYDYTVEVRSRFKGLDLIDRVPDELWNEAGQRLIEFCQENALVIANTLFQQHKRRLYTWLSPDGQHRNQIDYILCSRRWRNSIQSAKRRPGADCGSDHQLLIAKSKLKFKKVGKITRQFRYDLTKIPYDYTVEVMNRGKGLDLPEEQCIVQERVTKTILRKKKYKKAKWVSGEALQIAEERGQMKCK